MKTILTRSDIVGHTIYSVLQTPFSFWRAPVEEDSVSTCEVYVQLDSGRLFPLELPENVPAEGGIPEADTSNLTLFPAEFLGNDESEVREMYQSIIQEVVVSALWPTIGLLLSKGQFLNVGIHSHKVTTVGAVITCVWPSDEPDDYLTLWGRSPIPQFEALRAESERIVNERRQV